MKRLIIGLILVVLLLVPVACAKAPPPALISTEIYSEKSAFFSSLSKLFFPPIPY